MTEWSIFRSRSTSLSLVRTPSEWRNWNSGWAVLSALLLALPGCEPGVGSSCDQAEARCLNESTQLVCQEGKYVATPCRGPGGCALLPTVGVACDITRNKPGDVCAVGEEGVASCVNDHRMIVCRSGKYVFEPCRGADGCENSRGRARCDKSIALSGDPCKTDGEKACDTKRQELLECQGGKMTPLYRCLGENGCQVKGQLNCDLSVADKGDPCATQMEGAVACTPDRTGLVTCKGGKFVKDQDCAKDQVCQPGAATKCVKAPAATQHQ